jgi:hypothetical protein
MQIAEIQTGAGVGETGTVPRFHFTTADTAPCDRFDAWRKTIGVLFESTPPKRPSCSPFSATLTAFHFGAFVLSHSQIDAGGYRRSEARLQLDDLDHFVLSLSLSLSLSLLTSPLTNWARIESMHVGVVQIET